MKLRLRLLLPLAWRSVWRNPRRTVITAVVVSVGLWSILSFAVLLRAWSVSSRDTTLKLMTAEGQIHASGYRDDPTVAHRMPRPSPPLARVLDSPAVAAYAARVRGSAIAQSEFRTLPATLVGVSPTRERRLSVLPSQISQGRYLDGPDDAGVVLGRNLARRLKTRVGKRVVMMLTAADGHLAERAFPVVGLFAASRQAEDEFAFTGIRSAQALAGIGDEITEIAFDATDDKTLPALVDRLRTAAPELDVQPWKELAPLVYAVSSFFNEFVLVWFWVMFSLIAIGIVNTQLMAVFERTREFGLLQALGMSSRLVLAEVALESVLLIGFGVIVGAAAAFATVQPFRGGLDLGFLARGAELVGAGHVLYLRVNAGDFALYSTIVWLLCVGATLWPARRAARVSPAEAMGRTT